MSGVITRGRQRAFALAIGLVLVAAGMAWSFLYIPLRYHAHAWLTPPDLWATFRAAQYVGWGAMAAVYSSGSHLVTLPGIAILLAPVALVTDHLGLSVGFPRAVPHPSAWLVLGPVGLALATPLLTAADALMAELGLTALRRRLGVGALGALAFPVVAMLGHPEDALSMALALYALMAARKAQWPAAAWLFGISLCVQPLTLLMLPLVLGAAGRTRVGPFLIRAGLFPSVLVGLVLLGDGRVAWAQLLHQPNFPHASANHPTPWLATAHHISGSTVAAGPGRIIALVLALGLLPWGARYRHRLDLLLVGAAVGFALRSALEAVIVPYYLTPALVAAVIVAAGRGPARWWATNLVVLATTVVSFFHYGPWSYWALTVGGTALAIAGAALPAGVGIRRSLFAGHGGEDSVDETTGVLGRVALG